MYKVSISPSQQIENTCYYKDCNEQKHMFIIGGILYNLLERDKLFDTMITTKLPKMKQSEYLTKCVQETEKWQGKEGIRISEHSDGGYAGLGVSIFYYKNGTEGEKLAKIMYRKMCLLTPWLDLNCYARPELYEIRKPSCIAILIENSFHDKKESAEFLHNRADEIAKVQYEAILEYYNINNTNNTNNTDNAIKSGINIAYNKKYISDKSYWYTKSKKDEDIAQLFINISKY